MEEVRAEADQGLLVSEVTVLLLLPRQAVVFMVVSNLTMTGIDVGDTTNAAALEAVLRGNMCRDALKTLQCS